MESIAYITSGLVVILVAGGFGKYIGESSKVSDTHCNEKRVSCQELLTEKIDNLADRIESLTKAINGKMPKI